MHVLVASGSNVAFLVGLWYLLARLSFGLKKRSAFLTSLPLIWIYVLVVGADAPILRAGIMSTVGILAYLMAQEDRAYQALALAALSLLLFIPQTLFDVGFQMSFVTVFWNDLFPAEDGFLDKTVAGLGHMAGAFNLCDLISSSLDHTHYSSDFFIDSTPWDFSQILLVMPLAAGGLLAGLALVVVDLLSSFLPAFSVLLVVTKTLVSYHLKILIGIVSFFANQIGIDYWVSPSTLDMGCWILFGPFLLPVPSPDMDRPNRFWMRIGCFCYQYRFLVKTIFSLKT